MPLCLISIGFGIVCLCVASRKGRQHELLDEMSAMMAHPVNINILSNCYLSSDNKQLLKESAEYRFLLYIDSTECTECRLNHLTEYLTLDSLLKTISGQMLVIVAPKAHDTVIAKNFVDEYDFIPCILDTAWLFAKTNVYLPTHHAFHSFFINKRNEVILVGDPTRNKHVGELFRKHILKQEACHIK